MRVSLGLLAVLLPACVIDKSVGDDPESQGVQDDNGSSNSNGNSESDSTTAASGASVSVSSSQGGTGTATPSYQECGVTVVPVEPGGPVYTDALVCAAGCSITIESGAPTGFQGSQEIGNCLCDSIGCGGWTSESTTGADPTSPDGDSTTGSAACGYDPAPDPSPGLYSSRCVCETCEFVFEDISEADVSALDDTICACLCESGDCGGVQGYGEATSGGSTGDVGDSSGTTSTSG
jgi:hypothetical protein